MNAPCTTCADALAPQIEITETPRSAWLAVGSIAVGTFAMVTTEFLPIGLLTDIGSDLQVSDGTAGLMVTMPGVLAAFAGPALIVASGRLDRRTVMVWLTALLVASNLLAAFAPNFATVLVARLLLGLCVGANRHPIHEGGRCVRSANVRIARRAIDGRRARCEGQHIKRIAIRAYHASASVWLYQSRDSSDFNIHALGFGAVDTPTCIQVSCVDLCERHRASRNGGGK